MKRWAARLARTVLGLLLLVALLLAGGAAAQSLLARRDAARFPPPGQRVDVGGRRLHLFCSGRGAPTMVFEMGAGAPGISWTAIQREMAKLGRACLYDRAGYGWSDPGPLPRTADELVGDLHTLLERSGEPGPYLLAGHSLGGWIVRLYQARYPRQVVALALVESAHPRQWSELPPEIWRVTRASARPLDLLGRLGRFGVLRLMANRLAAQRLPAAVMPAYRALAIRPSALRTFASEIVASAEIAAAVDRLGDLGELPLAVVTAGRSFDAFRALAPQWPFDEANATWLRLQRDLTRLSSRSRQDISPDATHNIHSDDPDLVVRELTRLLEVVRTATPEAAEVSHPEPPGPDS